MRTGATFLQLSPSQRPIVTIAPAEWAAFKGQPRQFCWSHGLVGNSHGSFTTLIFNYDFSQRPHSQQIGVVDLFIAMGAPNPMYHSCDQIIDQIEVNLERIVALENTKVVSFETGFEKSSKFLSVNHFSGWEQCHSLFCERQNVDSGALVNNSDFSKHLALLDQSGILSHNHSVKSGLKKPVLITEPQAVTSRESVILTFFIRGPRAHVQGESPKACGHCPVAVFLTPGAVMVSGTTGENPNDYLVRYRGHSSAYLSSTKPASVYAGWRFGTSIRQQCGRRSIKP